MKLEDVFQSKQFSLLLCVALDTRKVSRLITGFVSYFHLLLFVYLASVDEFFEGSGSNESVDVDVSRLAVSVGSIHRLEVMCRVCEQRTAFENTFLNDQRKAYSSSGLKKEDVLLKSTEGEREFEARTKNHDLVRARQIQSRSSGEGRN